MNRIALGIEYDGSYFRGWQKQTNVLSIQQTLEIALSQVAAESINTICAGRTDAEVHATEQVVHFDVHADRNEHAWVFGANALLPKAVRVLWARQVEMDFNARCSAIGRRYRYVIYNHPLRPGLLRQYVAWYYRKLDAQKMMEASQYWLGEHDFSSFRAAECQSHSPIRSVYSVQVVRIGEQIILDFVANAFLYHMVRNMVGVLIKIGTGMCPPIWAKKVLEARDRRAADITASPSGLYLVEVQYPMRFNLPKIQVGPWFLKMSEEKVLA
jgi:tRNA pseudouridine38-40 synthase